MRRLPPAPHTVRTVVALIPAVALLAACFLNGDPMAGPLDPSPGAQLVKFEIYAGDGQRAAAGTRLPVALTTVLEDERHQHAGHTVTWRVLSGGGTLSATSGVSDANGRVSVYWTLGPEAGPQSVEADSDDPAHHVVFHATAVRDSESISAPGAGR